MGFTPPDTKGLKRLSVLDAERKVCVEDFGRPFGPGASFSEFIGSLPRILGAKDLVDFTSEVLRRKKSGGIFIMGMGAHPIKVGITPFIIDLVKSGFVDLLATNGASMVHDLEIAFMGRTSEDVSRGIEDGTFGMGKEMSDILNLKVGELLKKGMGLGEALGRVIDELGLPHAEKSLFCNCYRCGVPITVHLALGTDVFNMHPEFDPSLFGGASYRDFLTFSGAVGRLDGGAFLLVGSAVILPEVYLKAFTISRNLGKLEGDVVTCVFDFFKHYRPMENVVKRTSRVGYYVVGHHEILFPIFYGMVKEGGSC